MKFKTLIFCLFIVILSACEHDSELSMVENSFEELAAIPATVQSPPPPGYENTNTRKLIKSGSLKFETEDIEKTLHSIKNATQTVGGYIGSENTTGTDYITSNLITVRVPSAQFDIFLNTISKGVQKFDERDISSQDVTEEFVDLGSRSKAKKKLEQRYLEILKTAKNVKEILEVEAELGAIREQIERAEGRLRYLESQTTMSTILIEFYKVTHTNPAEEKSTFISEIKDAVSNGLSVLRALFIGVINIWPILLLLIGGYFIYRSRKKTAKA